ncbi:MAG TPA: hypothetical protein PLP07_00475 [Pyrinomonadaceae bacterium]|nr:hypothetical protein [Chloracidobacterium sp.]MBP9934222.1 hypothetical protein [Pyrinomonadaceae bacterium]MBK7801582.1 hypothetical protein [Chloracidobacterium sp.]MBK9436898.1 hypothetical protein [Chloracidobacterium sp.]MBK9766556.1 hypothetical protein [Chloracidobacterium sp.]
MIKARYLRFVSKAIGGAFLLAAVAPMADAQKTKGLIVEGVSYEKVLIGKTTMQEVKTIYGKNYETFENGNYSVVISYKSLGLSFYACTQDPKKEIFDITFEAPAKVRSSKGIILGKSKLSDVFRIYEGQGEQTYSDSDQTGVLFFVREDSFGDDAYQTLSPDADAKEMRIHNAKIIKRIELIEATESRQCDAKFGPQSNQ